MSACLNLITCVILAIESVTVISRPWHMSLWMGIVLRIVCLMSDDKKQGDIPRREESGFQMW